jgi:hypothetical protein
MEEWKNGRMEEWKNLAIRQFDNSIIRQWKIDKKLPAANFFLTPHALLLFFPMTSSTNALLSALCLSFYIQQNFP